MSRLSFRPRPLDIHKKLPIVKSIKEFEEDDAPTATSSTRNSLLPRVATAHDSEKHRTLGKKISQEIPTPQFSTVETYERDYSQTFSQTTSYIHARGARAEIGEFVEYDLDNEDEDWLEEFNNERKILSPEKFETLLFKLEILDHKARERAGVLTPTFGAPVPVLLQLESAAEALQSLSVRSIILQSVYNYWKSKREQWQKPILHHLQPPPPVNDTNPYNVFRPREKAHRLHTRRMQRRENNVQSFEKLRQVRLSLEQAKRVVEVLIKREQKKREFMECAVNLQRTKLKYKHEAQLVDDRMALSGFPGSWKFTSSDDDDDDDDDDMDTDYTQSWPASFYPNYADSNLMVVRKEPIKRELKQRYVSDGWLERMDPDEPIMLFSKPLDSDRLAAFGIMPPSHPPTDDGSVIPAFRARIGRGGRIIFDRCDPHLPLD
ncbi:enhancer of polycomb-like protein 1 [Zingiber officinale]|nr:enhancer of polycomb-like protein 1 [Zingiber officinale]